MLTFNLSKADRVVLHMRIASSRISPKELSTMSSTDLASEEEKQSIKKLEEEALAHSILKKSIVPRAKLTHKGLQDIEDVTGAGQREVEREREEEAERRRAERRAAERAAPAAASGRPSIFGRNATAAETGGNAWRRSTPVPERTASPAPAAPTPVAADAAPAKYRPGALGGGGGWRAREQAKAAGASGTPSPRPASPAQPPASPAKADAPKDDDGFQTVASRGVWRPRGGRA